MSIKVINFQAATAPRSWLALALLGLAALAQPAQAALKIAEFRVRGPSGANDEYVTLYNDADTTHTVTASTGTGYGLAASDGVVRFTVPNGTVIPARGFYLGVNSVAYSLASYPAGSGTTATGDATYTTDIADNAGIALFSTNVPGDFAIGTRLDAVGSTSEANTLYKEGTGYPALTPFSIDYAFYRDLCGKGGSISTFGPCPSGGAMTDTDNNATDFIFVDTNGTSAGAGQRLGAPGPRNLSSPPWGPTVPVTEALLDPCVAKGAAPNRVREFTSDDANNSTFGTLDFRRSFTNDTGSALERLRYRIVDLTTFPAPSGIADLRPRTSTATVVTVDRVPCGPGTSNVTVQGTTLEQPPSQPNGGGFNSTLSAGTVSLATPLVNGASIDLRFLFGIQQTGTYKARLVIEGLNYAGGVTGQQLVEFEGSTEGSGPTVVLTQAAGQADPASSVPVNFTATFSDNVTGFTGTDVALSGTAGATTATVTGGPRIYNIAVSGMTSNGTVIATLPAGAAQDIAPAPSLASFNLDNSVTLSGADFTLPTVTINQAAGQVDPTAASPVHFSVVFSEPVTGFTAASVVLSGTAGATTATVTGSGTTYDVAVLGMAGNGTVVASLVAGAGTDAGLNPSAASTSTDNTVTYNGFDVLAPTVTVDQAVGQADPTAVSPIHFSVVFSEPVTGFGAAGVVLAGTAGATTAVVTGSGTTYDVAVSGMTGNGTVVATLAAGAAVDASLNPSAASTSADNTVQFNGIDTLAPTVTIGPAPGQANPGATSPIVFRVVFSEPVTGFSAAGVVLAGTAGAATAVVTGSGTTYDVAVSGMTGNGTVVARIAAGAATDAASNANVASIDASVTFGAALAVPTWSAWALLLTSGLMAFGALRSQRRARG